jgi:hemerythrin-like metal-binding protein
MRLIWNAELVTGVRQIDLQHQELIELINELESAHERGQDEMGLADVLPRLTSYALFHFGTEEGLMAKVTMNTADAQNHLNAHRQFTEKVIRMRAASGENSTEAVALLLDYLTSWLREHIMKTDKALAKLILVRPV